MPSDVTRYCDKTVKLSNTENFKVLSMMLLQISCRSFMEPDANSKLFYIYIYIFFLRPPVVHFILSYPYLTDIYQHFIPFQPRTSYHRYYLGHSSTFVII